MGNLTHTRYDSPVNQVADEPHKAVADWVCDHIAANEYLLFPLLDREDFLNLSFTLRLK